jgi:hypothetical protein
MTIRCQYERILRGDFVEARLKHNQGNCCNSAGKTPSVLKQWRDQAKKDTVRFLEKQFEKPVEKFDRLDWRDVKLKCLKFLPAKKRKLIEEKTGRGSKDFFVALHDAREKNSTVQLSEKEALKLIKSVFKRDADQLTVRQKESLMSNVDLLSRLPKAMVKKYDLAPTYRVPKEQQKKRPSVLDFLKSLPHDASPARIDKALLSVPKLGKLGRVDPDTKRLVFPADGWKLLIRNKQSLPEPIKLRYAEELGLLNKKRGRKPQVKEPNVLTPEEFEAQEANKERRARQLVKKQIEDTRKKQLKVVKKPEKKLVNVVKKRSQDDIDDSYFLDDSDTDLSDVIDEVKPKVPEEVDDTKVFLTNENDVVKFINKQANKALLPDEVPRYSNYPKAEWGVSDWALVNVYRDRIQPRFLEDNKEKINNALRRLGISVGASVRDLMYDEKLALNMISLYRTFSIGGSYYG